MAPERLGVGQFQPGFGKFADGQGNMWQFAVGKHVAVDEFAAAAVFLASDQASFMTGSIIRVDGGQIASTM